MNLHPPEAFALFWSSRAATQLLNLLVGGLMEGLWWCYGISHGDQWSR